MSNSEDFYSVLGVNRQASDSDIKSAYRRQAMKYHPDRNPGNAEAEAKFKSLSEAYEVLKDKNKRAAYDQYGHDAFKQAQSGGGGGQGGFGGGSIFEDLNDIFEGMMGGGQRQRRQQRGQSIRADIELTLEDAFNGIKKAIKFQRIDSCKSCDGQGTTKKSKRESCGSCGGSGRQRISRGFFTFEQPCSPCRGTGEIVTNPCQECGGLGIMRANASVDIDIPAGVEDGMMLRVDRQGSKGERGIPAGDLMVGIHIKKHEFFTRGGSDLLCSHPIDMTKAALGDQLMIVGIDNSNLKVKVPAGSQPRHRLKLKGEGMPVINSGGRRGDLYIELNIEVPVSLSDKQQKMLREFYKTIDENNSPRSFSFSRKVKELWEKVSR